jgi:hypothetical protein
LYGGKGVRMCDEWLNDFLKFQEWAIANGWEKGLQVDKDIKAKALGVEPLLYSPEFCSIVNGVDNMNSTSANFVINHNGESKTLAQWARAIGMNRATIRQRLRSGWDTEDAHNPITVLNRAVVCETTGETFSCIGDASMKTNIPRGSIYRVLTGRRNTINKLVFKYVK